jgi:hypothetical protein
MYRGVGWQFLKKYPVNPCCRSFEERILCKNKKIRKRDLLKSRFPVIHFLLSAFLRVTPYLPQRGRNPKGSIPLTPLFLEGFNRGGKR